MTRLLMCIFALGAILVGCGQESVSPTGRNSNADLMAAAADSVHPALDTICKITQPIRFRSNDGSWKVNKRAIVGSGGCFEMITDPTVLEQQPDWGSFVMYNGYTYTNNGPQHWLDCDFTLAAGWMVDFTDWVFTVNNTITVDPNTNLPLMGTDWSNLQVNPLRNEWKVSILVDQLPSPCFDMACRVSAVRLYLGGVPGGANCLATVPQAPNENTRTILWAINENWNVTGHDLASNNQFAVHYCPLGCLEGAATPMDSVCVATKIGVPALTGCTTLNATQTGTSVTYAWSTGATTASINVCPTTNTSYTVTISDGGNEVLIRKYKVKVTNIRCGGTNQSPRVWVCTTPPGNPNSQQTMCVNWNTARSCSGFGGGGNGGSGSGNGGSGSGNGGSGSGNGGSGSGQGGNNCSTHNGHHHGCSGQHSGNNNSCNHSGHGRNCGHTHANNRACGGGHTRGCDGNHTNNQTCQSRGGHRYNCNGNHNTGNCNSSLSHAQGCNGNHNSYRGCNVSSNHGSGSGCNGNGGSGSGNGGSGSGNGGGGGCNNGGGGNTCTLGQCGSNPCL